MNAMQEMMGKSVMIDGCHVGYVKSIGLEQVPDSYITMHIDITMTADTIDKLKEYSYISHVFGENKSY